MSLILNALDKADHEDAAPELVPGLRSQLRRFTSRDSGTLLGLPKYATVTIVLLSIVVLILSVSLIRQANTSAIVDEPHGLPAQVSVEKQEMASSSEPVVANEGLRAPAPSETAALETALNDSSPQQGAKAAAALPELPSPALSPEVAALYQNRPTRSVSAAPRKEIVIKPSTGNGYAPSSAEVAMAQQLWEASKPQPLPDSLKPFAREGGVPVAASQAGAKSASEQQAVVQGPSIDALANVRFLHQLPVSIQNRIPTINYAKHEYLGGYVVLNKQTVTVGAAVESNVILEGLYTDGIVLRMGDHTFKLSALSSWINF